MKSRLTQPPFPPSTLFSFLSSTHSFMATIDIVDYYLGAILPSPESVRIDDLCLPSPSPPLQNLVSFLFSATLTANLFSSAMFFKLSPAFPNPNSYPNFVLSLFSPNMGSPKPPPPCTFATTPHCPSLSRREDMDPTSSWVLALLCKSTGPIPPHRCLPTFLSSIYPHSTRPYLCPPPPQPFLTHPELSLEKCGEEQIGIQEGSHRCYAESHRQSCKDKQSLIRASRLLQSHPSYVTPSPLTHDTPLHAFCQRIPVVVASVAEAEYAAAFGGGQISVGRAHAHPNQPWPPSTVTPSPIRRQRMNARSVLQLLRLDRRSASRSTCV
jgi:hypothetical protein